MKVKSTRKPGAHGELWKCRDYFLLERWRIREKSARREVAFVLDLKGEEENRVSENMELFFHSTLINAWLHPVGQNTRKDKPGKCEDSKDSNHHSFKYLLFGSPSLVPPVHHHSLMLETRGLDAWGAPSLPYPYTHI